VESREPAEVSAAQCASTACKVK